MVSLKGQRQMVEEAGEGGSMPSAGLVILLGSHPTDLTLWTHGPSDLAPFYVILAVSKVW